MKRALLVLLVALLCTAGKPRRAYERGHDEWTRSLKIYNNFGTMLLLDATYLHEHFRELLADERKRLMGDAVDAADHQAFIDRMSTDNSAFHEIYFGADSNSDAGRRFGDDDRGWRLRLLADGMDQPLESLYQVRKPNALQLGLYPQIDNWNELWIARFHKATPEPDELVLHVGSGLGHGEIRWQNLRSR